MAWSSTRGPDCASKTAAAVDSCVAANSCFSFVWQILAEVFGDSFGAPSENFSIRPASRLAAPREMVW